MSPTFFTTGIYTNNKLLYTDPESIKYDYLQMDELACTIRITDDRNSVVMWDTHNRHSTNWRGDF